MAVGMAGDGFPGSGGNANIGGGGGGGGADAAMAGGRIGQGGGGAGGGGAGGAGPKGTGDDGAHPNNNVGQGGPGGGGGGGSLVLIGEETPTPGNPSNIILDSGSLLSANSGMDGNGDVSGGLGQVVLAGSIFQDPSSMVVGALTALATPSSSTFTYDIEGGAGGGGGGSGGSVVTPEPSTFVAAATGALVALGYAWLSRRRSAA
jgi:hypothetical protein